ncbi:MAG: septum formation family protein [Gemmatimonadales bacterium]
MLEGRSILGIAGAAVAAVIGITTAAQRNDAGEITAAGAVDAFEVRLGDCFDDEAFESSEISEIPAVPCSQPHDNEIYALFDIQGEWPGSEGVEEIAYQGCLDRFAGAIGKAYEDSEIDYTVLYPTEGSWKQRNDREVICVGYHMEYEKLTGSIRGSGR